MNSISLGLSGKNKIRKKRDKDGRGNTHERVNDTLIDEDNSIILGNNC